MEHLALDPGESKDRQVHHSNDGDTKQAGTNHFVGGLEHQLQTFLEGQLTLVLGLGQAPDTVLDDDDRAVDDQAEIQRPQTHQIGGYARPHHTGDGGEHRKRNDSCRDQGGAQVAQQQKQHHDHQQCPFKQVLLHRGNRLVHQGCAVVYRLHLDAVGQGGLNGLQLFGHRLCYRPGIFPHQHHGGAHHRFLAVAGGGSGAQLLANGHFSYIGYPDWRTIPVGNHHLFNIANGGQLPGRAHQQLLAVAFDIAGAAIGVIGPQGADQFIHRDAELQQPLGRRRDVVLLVVAANGVDLDHAGHLGQLGFDDPVLDLPQCRSVQRTAIRLSGAGQGFYGVHEDLAKTGGDGTHLRLQPGWQRALDGAQSLIDQIAGEIDVRAFLEHHRDLGQAVAGQGPGIGQVGQAVQGRFHREGDALLCLQGRIARCLGVDLYLDIGDIRHRVDGQALKTPHAHADQHQNKG